MTQEDLFVEQFISFRHQQGVDGTLTRALVATDHVNVAAKNSIPLVSFNEVFCELSSFLFSYARAK